MNSNNDLTKGNELKVLIAFALPFLFASFMQALYGAVDMFAVGQFSGISAISAVNIGSQIMQIVTSFLIGISMGTTVTMGHSIGSGNDRSSELTIGTTIILFSVFAIVATPLMIYQSGNIVSLMHTPIEAQSETIHYVVICSMGFPFIVAYNVIAAILRGMGDSKTPMLFVGVACIINVLGDFFLTGFFDMGATGAACATVAAQGFSSLCGMVYLIKKGFTFSFNKGKIRLDKNILKKILFIGMPIALQDTLISISFMIITVIANERGVIASSAVGVVEKIIMFMFLVPSAMLSAISAITAQNIGAGRKERALLTVKCGIVITVFFGLIMCGISWIVPDCFTGVFTDDKEVIIAASDYLKTYSIDCILVGFTFCINGYLCGIEKSVITFIHNTISIFFVRIPVAYVLSKMYTESLLPMGLASPAGSLVSIIIVLGCLMWINRKHYHSNL